MATRTSTKFPGASIEVIETIQKLGQLWQPMESAPTNGARILVVEGNGSIGAAAAHPCPPNYGWWFVGGGKRAFPVAWLPLPHPPQPKFPPNREIKEGTPV